MFDYSRAVTILHEIPPLSWLISLSEKPRILVGNKVEVSNTDGNVYIADGCWDGDFNKRDFATAVNFFGSGLVAGNDSILFCAATHTLESLYVHCRNDNWIVSNSLSFLVRYSSLSLDPSQNVFKRAHTLLNGVRSYEKKIYQKDEDTIYRLAYCNFTIADGVIRTFDKAHPPRFPDFESYKTYLLDVLRRLRDNANAESRLTKYTPLTTLSSGYDSAACASLGITIGCETALTLRSGRTNVIDSGKNVADALGLRCIEKDRTKPSSTTDDYVEAQFIAAFDPGDFVLHVFAQEFRDSLILTGHHGGGVWTFLRPPNDELKSADPSGMGLYEFRLRNNCIFVAVPFIGAASHPDLYAITHSAEMAPYRMGVFYDRPIPRRIAEEAGVPRKDFGQKKKAANTSFWLGERMISPEAERSIEAFVSRQTGPLFWVEDRTLRVIQYVLDFFMNWSQNKGEPSLPGVGSAKRVARFALRWTFPRYQKTFGYRKFNSYVLIWALQKTGRDYPEASEVGTGSKSLQDA